MTTSERLIAILARLNDEELQVVEMFASRLLMGQTQYGPLDLANDGRDFAAEILAEQLDSSAYACMHLVRVKVRK